MILILHFGTVFQGGSTVSVTYDYYRIFYYVAKYHSFTRAAKILINSQPNITRAMNNLEQELGCRLFLRSNRGVTLTPEGEKLFAHVQIAMEQLQAGEAAVTAVRGLHSGHLSIGVSEIALHGLLLPVLRDFHLDYPGIHIQVFNHSTPQAVEAVKKGTVDFSVVTSPVSVSKPVRELPLIHFQDILIAGPHFSHLAGHTLSLKDLSQFPLICLGRDTTTFLFYDQLFSQHGLLLEPDIEAATTDQILPMVKFDLGLGFLPQFFAREAVEKGEVFPIPLQETIPSRHICLIRDQSRPLSTAAQQLEKRLMAVCSG